MNILKSTSWLLIIFFAAASIFGLTSGLQLLLFCFGLKEFLSAKEYYDNQQKKLAIASVIIGIFVCLCIPFYNQYNLNKIIVENLKGRGFYVH